MNENKIRKITKRTASKTRGCSGNKEVHQLKENIPRDKKSKKQLGI